MLCSVVLDVVSELQPLPCMPNIKYDFTAPYGLINHKTYVCVCVCARAEEFGSQSLYVF